MSDAFHAMTTEPWAIEPSWLPLLAALALRGDPHAADRKAWADREALLSANAVGGRLPGARYATVTSDGVAVLPIIGPIFPRANMMTEMSGATSISMLQADYRLAQADPDVGAIALLIDSPGGAVSGVSAFADQVFAGRKGSKPVVAHVAGTMASAAFWIGAQASRITAERTGLIGSVGVAAAIPKRTGPDKDGNSWIEVVSSNAPNKRPDPGTDDGVAQLRKMLDGIEVEFIADLARARGTTATRVKSDFGQGGVEPARAAKDIGMIDGISSFDDVLRGLGRDVRNQRRAKALAK